MPSGKTPGPSDREKAGLRGPVQSCTEERTTPTVAGFPETKYVSVTEYDREGRVVKMITFGQDGAKWIASRSYDERGNLVKTSSGKADAPADETIYHYDEKGRLAGYGGQGMLGRETTRFEYDEQGRKTRVVTSDAPASPAGPYGATAMSYSAIGGDLSYPVPQGGKVKTVYDESDRPVEAQIYTADGQMLQRLVQSYDQSGRITETKIVMGDLSAMLPEEAKAELMKEPGGVEELQRQFAELLGGLNEMFKTSYVYDARGLLIERRDHVGYSEETVTSYAYDDNGNKIKEMSKTSGDVNPPRRDGGAQGVGDDARAAAAARNSEVTYSYKYDGYGNWIEQSTRAGTGAEGAAADIASSRRTIVYY